MPETSQAAPGSDTSLVIDALSRRNESKTPEHDCLILSVDVGSVIFIPLSHSLLGCPAPAAIRPAGFELGTDPAEQPLPRRPSKTCRDAQAMLSHHPSLRSLAIREPRRPLVPRVCDQRAVLCGMGALGKWITGSALSACSTGSLLPRRTGRRSGSGSAGGGASSSGAGGAAAGEGNAESTHTSSSSSSKAILIPAVEAVERLAPGLIARCHPRPALPA